ncbi:hypothetical protein GCM10011351_18020 [Paraliobacillus quinghaiensis]|uniref:Methyltransferase domain-containing protein n=1 Tax=Paraliobacillus quinghaiensis TaxID=470815 RepID=A0A917TPS8_9BACI|nr:methyltransferase domain-containing protein [Paraliobacillus quinghaiensis]GGM32336.1 hypothetical protein GCM10011351_18020 [Paraliobacillus quinghaiensis]
MEEIKDHVYDAYYFKRGYEFGEKVRKRINWMLTNVTGNYVLDVGCSQGVTSIILGREKKNVIGIDLSSSAICDALENLELEELDTKDRVLFKQANFFNCEFDTKFDTIILGEILEHIADIDSFFHKAYSLLKDKGKIVVTTPFGINDFVDHKRTFYINDLLKLQRADLPIIDIEYLGGWIGVVFKKGDSSIKEIDGELLGDLEDAFYLKERNLVDKIKTNNKGTASGESELAKLHKKYIDEKIEKVKAQNELHDQYRKERELLNAYNKLKKEHNNLTKKYNAVNSRYESIRKSKLGKITVKYWDIRKGWK